MYRYLIILIFLISGMAGLTYEVVWVRMLTLVFGTTTYAVSTVLFSFMAGLALGSYLFGRYVDSSRAPLLLYALLEIGIGVSAYFVPQAIDILNTAYVSMFDENIPNQFIYSISRFGFSMTVLLVPTTLMGATLPVLSRYFVRKLSTVGWDVGILYTINTLGAVIGALLAGYYLEAKFGVRTTINIAVVANLLAGLTALLIYQTTKNSESRWHPVKEETQNTAGNNAVAYPRLAVIFWVFAISGFCAIGFEVIWFRTLLLALYNTTYAFTTMLVAFLAGLAIGSYLITTRLDEEYNWPAVLGYTLIGIGVIAALTVPLFILYHNNSFLESRDLFATSHMRVTVGGFYLSGLLMLVPTIAMGLTLPLANKIYIDNMKLVGHKIGRLYAINTLGGVLGSLITGFMLIPLIGIIKAGFVLAAFYIIAGIVVLHYNPSLTRFRKPVYMTGGLLVVALTGSTFISDWPSRLHITMAEGLTPISYREGASSTVTVVEMGNTRAAFVNGNIVVGATPGAKQTVRLLAHLPVLLQENPKSAVIIGFGMGITTYSLSLHNLQPTDVVEIAPEILESAHLFSYINHAVYDSDKINITVEDGRNYLLRTRNKYSVITADPTHPILGSGNLYTLEYYQQARNKLDEDGIIVQYVPLHLLRNTEFRTLINTFAKVFEHCSLWYSTSDLVIMGSKQPIKIDFARLEQDISRPAIKEDLELSHIGTAPALLGRLLMGEKQIHQYVQGADINTDDHPIIEFRGPTSVGHNTRATNLQSIIDFLSRTEDYVDLSGLAQDRQEQVLNTLRKIDWRKQHLVKGLMYDASGKPGPAILEYNAALSVDMNDPVTQRLIREARNRFNRMKSMQR